MCFPLFFLVVISFYICFFIFFSLSAFFSSFFFLLINFYLRFCFFLCFSFSMFFYLRLSVFPFRYGAIIHLKTLYSFIHFFSCICLLFTYSFILVLFIYSFIAFLSLFFHVLQAVNSAITSNTRHTFPFLQVPLPPLHASSIPFFLLIEFLLFE